MPIDWPEDACLSVDDLVSAEVPKEMPGLSAARMVRWWQEGIRYEDGGEDGGYSDDNGSDEDNEDLESVENNEEEKAAGVIDDRHDSDEAGTVDTTSSRGR